MRIPFLRRGDEGPPPLPSEPLFTTEYRGDGLPSPPFSDDPSGLDDAAGPRPSARPPSLRPGDRVRDRSLASLGEEERWHIVAREMATPIRAGVTPEMLAAGWSAESSSRTTGWALQPDPTRAPYPSRIYAAGDIAGLRWERLNGRGMWVLHYDEATVLAERPAWLAFGPNGAAVAEVLETVASLTPWQVRSLPVPVGIERGRIAVELIEPPRIHPLQAVAARAASTAMVWSENRGWAVDPAAGRHFIRGCYFRYELDEPHWLSVMGRAMNAAVLAALGGDTQTPAAVAAAREWIQLLEPAR